MGPLLELLAAVLVLVDRAQDRDDLLFGRERNGTRDFRAAALGDVNDLGRGLIREGASPSSSLSPYPEQPDF